MKASFAITHKEGLVVGACSLPGNPYDGHTLPKALTQTEKLMGILPKMAFVDKGYGGAKMSAVEVYRPGLRRGMTRRLRQMIKRMLQIR